MQSFLIIYCCIYKVSYYVVLYMQRFINMYCFTHNVVQEFCCLTCSAFCSRIRIRVSTLENAWRETG